MINCKKFPSKGFTLVEVLTVVAIISIVSAIVWMNHHVLDRELSFERSVHALAEDFRGALEMTLSAYFDENKSLDFAGRHGVFFPEGESYYIVFADTENTGDYQEADGDEIRKVWFEGATHLGKIKIDEVTFEGCSPSATNYSVIFMPPDPEVIIGGDSNCLSVSIKIKHEDLLGKTGEVSVNRAGLIEVSTGKD